MSPRKPRQRHGSGASPASSSAALASIRIGSSAGGFTRVDEHATATPTTPAQAAPPGGRPTFTAEQVANSPAMLRSNALLLLVAAISTTAFALTELATGHFRELGVGYLWLVASALTAWLGYALRERGRLAAWAAAVGVLAIHALLGGAAPSALLLATMLAILTWTGTLLRPRDNALLAGYALVAMLVTGGELVLEPTEIGDPSGRKLPLPMLLTFVAVPLGIGATLHLRLRAVQDSLRASVAELERQSAELERRLEGKSTELELSREQLFEAQKLKTVGTMASGLAHELNNILTPIRGHAELIAEGVPNLEQARRYGQRILDSAAAAAHITGTLLTYTRQGTFQPVRSNLRQLLQGQILPVLSKSLPGNIHLKVELARNVSADVDRVLLQQAIANLVFNAVDAMPEGGEITVALTTSSLPAAKQDNADSLESGDGDQISAVIEIRDDGTGIAAEHIDQIFDPFFTTKAVGSGSGLGLAMVMGTVTRHNGRVTVSSELGEGTTFKIWLPLAASDDKGEGPKPWPVLRGEAKGPVVVVLTEDQDALDEFEELLEGTECAPICTSDAKGATPLLTEMGDKVDLLILDLALEATDGKRLFKAVRELFPEMPIILLSDQPTDPAVQRMITTGPTRSVRKPMDNRLFSALLTDLLNPADGYVRDFTPVPITPGAEVSGVHPRAG